MKDDIRVLALATMIGGGLLVALLGQTNGAKTASPALPPPTLCLEEDKK